MAGKSFKDGPSALATSAADIYNPSANTVANVRHIHAANAAASAATLNLYVGLTGGSANGTEICEGYTIAANDVADFYFPAGLRLTSSDFLSGFASATTVVLTVMGDLEAA
jgi:hypothetical protein